MSSPGFQDFLDMVAGIQGSRMDDQRADLKFPGLNSQEVIDQILQQKDENVPDDNFFEMLMRCQVVFNLIRQLHQITCTLGMKIALLIVKLFAYFFFPDFCVF